MTPQQIQQLNQLQQDLTAFQAEFYRGNFTSNQEFSKSVKFNARMKVPHFASTPATGEVGEIIEVGGKYYGCATANNWVVLGTQS